jgi:hypothetical protein
MYASPQFQDVRIEFVHSILTRYPDSPGLVSCKDTEGVIEYMHGIFRCPMKMMMMGLSADLKRRFDLCLLKENQKER